MAYNDDCDGAREAQRDIESLRYRVNDLEAELQQVRSDHNDDIQELQNDIRALWQRLKEMPASI